MNKTTILIASLIILAPFISGCNKSKISTINQPEFEYVQGKEQTSNTGLRITFQTVGSGELPKINDNVRCDYVLKLEDGTQIDSSYLRGNSIIFAVDEVIKGLKEALLIMPSGSTVSLVIPPDLAYGSEGVYPHIKPNETLLYEVTLHSIE